MGFHMQRKYVERMLRIAGEIHASEGGGYAARRITEDDPLGLSRARGLYGLHRRLQLSVSLLSQQQPGGFPGGPGALPG